MQVVDRANANVKGWPVPSSPRVVDTDPHDGGRTPTLGPQTGFAPLAQAILKLQPGEQVSADSADNETVLFVLGGSGVLRVNAAEHELEPETGVYLAPGEGYELECTGDDALRIVRVTIPEPEPISDATGQREVVRRLADQRSQDATTDREFRIVADPGSGLRSATHFVGYIPVARAPDHFHTYDEVIYVLDGEGVFHAGELHEPLRPGSCVQLPARTVHCLENTGTDTMRVVAVFRPAGSPAAAYYPDGTPAYVSDSN